MMSVAQHHPPERSAVYTMSNYNAMSPTILTLEFGDQAVRCSTTQLGNAMERYQGLGTFQLALAATAGMHRWFGESAAHDQTAARLDRVQLLILLAHFDWAAADDAFSAVR